MLNRQTTLFFAAAVFGLTACARPVDEPLRPNQGPSQTTTPSPDPTGTPDAPPSDVPDPAYTGPFVRFMGRVTPGSTATSKTFSWAGTSAIARFKGTSVTATLNRNAANDKSFYSVYIDGAKVGTIDPSLSTFTATVSATEAHEIKLVRRNEEQYGEAEFVGFTVAGGSLLKPAAAPTRRIEIIGDSISVGYGVLGGTNAKACVGTFDNGDATDTYGYLAAAALKADVNITAWSGKGMYRNNDYSLTDTMPELWKRANALHADVAWDPSVYQPQIVLINLGTNDFSNDTTISAQFVSTYVAFLSSLRAVYPQATFMMGIGPMLVDSDAAKTRTQVLSALQSVLAQSTVGKLSIVDFGVQDVDAAGNGAACDFHPTIATQQKMSQVLQAAITKAVGWN